GDRERGAHSNRGWRFRHQRRPTIRSPRAKREGRHRLAGRGPVTGDELGLRFRHGLGRRTALYRRINPSPDAAAMERIDYGYMTRERGTYTVSRSLSAGPERMTEEMPADEEHWFR